VEPELTRIFFRSIMGPEPTDDDFKSYEALGRRPRQADPEFLERWRGVSVYDSYRQARKNARAVNWRIGTHIAELNIPDDARIRYVGPGPTGHWDLHDADPSYLRLCVVRVIHAPSTDDLSG
jgi:hypothetical protein